MSDPKGREDARPDHGEQRAPGKGSGDLVPDAPDEREDEHDLAGHHP